MTSGEMEKERNRHARVISRTGHALRGVALLMERARTKTDVDTVRDALQVVHDIVWRAWQNAERQLAAMEQEQEGRK